MKSLALTLILAASAAAGDAPPETGIAVMRGTAEGSAVSGQVRLTESKDGLKIFAKLAGLPPGEHGFHIHEFGRCEDAGKAAGGHYNPGGAPHGHALKNHKKAHAGDLGNIVVGADGTALLELTLAKLSLSGGRRSAAGRALIVHEKADDFSQPLGNAGGRIACGVIVLAP